MTMDDDDDEAADDDNNVQDNVMDRSHNLMDCDEVSQSLSYLFALPNRWKS